MKQYRDVVDPDRACYQSITRIHRTLDEVLDFREIEEPLVVHVHEFPTQPLVQKLGLVGKFVRGDGVGMNYLLQPIRPFWMRVTMDEALGQRMSYRAESDKWIINPDTRDSYF